MVLVSTLNFVLATEFTEPGTYEIKPGDTITFNDLTVQVIDIKTNDNNVSWEEDFGREMVYLGTPGLGFYVYVDEKMELVKAKYSSEKPIAVIVNSIDIENKKAEVQFIDNYDDCILEYKKKCQDSDVYWEDSCGRTGELLEDCDSEGCETTYGSGKCINQGSNCIPNYTSYCYHLDAYWRDSCGNEGGLKKDCRDGCLEGECKENILIEKDSPTCGDGICNFKDFESIYMGSKDGQAQFEGCFEDCPSDINDPLDMIVEYHMRYDSEGKRENSEDYYYLRINNEGNERVDIADLIFVVTGIDRGITQYNLFNEFSGEINSGEKKEFKVKTGFSGSLSESLCGEEFSFALRKKDTDRLYHFNGGKFLKCVDSYPVEPVENKPLDIPEVDEKKFYDCQGCELDKKCYSFGYRKSKKYCSDEGDFKLQLKTESTCENNFECDSNVCVDDKCVSGSLIWKIINWFKRLFS